MPWGQKPRLTTEKFIENSRKVHGDTYNYSKTQYVRSNVVVTVTCRIHGDFEIKPINHTSGGHGCAVCGREKSKKGIIRHKVWPINKVKKFLTKFKNLSFPKLEKEFVSHVSPLTAVCSKHGEFKTTLRTLYVSKHGCVKCSIDYRGKVRRRDLKELAQEISDIYIGRPYALPNLAEVYTDNKSKIEIECLPHGKFLVRVNDILTKKSGCPRCKAEDCSKRLRHDFESFVEAARKVHGDRYEYLEDKFPEGLGSSKQTTTIICKTHGPFEQKVQEHLTAVIVGCPRCANTSSQQEQKVSEWLTKWGVLHKRRSRQTIKDYEIDIVIESQKLLIELNGVYWHTTEFKEKFYHYDKRQKAEEHGYRTIQIWEDEMLENEDGVREYLKSQLNVAQVRVFARKCTLKTVDKNEARKFLDQNHLQGSGAFCQEYFALYHNSVIVAVAGVKKSFDKTKALELHRVGYLRGHRVIGALGKFIKHFSKLYQGRVMMSYVDRDKFDGRSYLKSGFQKTSHSLMMWYVVKSKRQSRHKFKKSKIAHLKSFSPEKTERQILEEVKIYQAWNSGVDRVYVIF